MFLDSSYLFYNWIYLTDDEQFIFNQKLRKTNIRE